jgi:hypothetical protein
MKNVVKTDYFHLFFTVIVIGLFGISTVSMVNDVLAEKINKKRTVTPKEVHCY